MSSIAFIAIVAGILLVVGTIVAMAWFTMSRKIAPYRDELEARERRKADDENVVVIDRNGQSRSAGPGAHGGA